MRPLVVAGYIYVVVAWGLIWAAVKVGIEGVPPFTLALDRALGTAVLLTGISLVFRLPFPRRRAAVIAACATNLIQAGLSWALVNWAEQFVPSGLVALFGSTSPLWTAMLAHFLAKGDRLSLAKAVALLLGVAGTLLLVGAPSGVEEGGRGLLAVALLALMPVMWAVAAMIQVRTLRHLSPLPTLAIGTWASVLFLVPFAATEIGRPQHWTPQTIGALAYLVIFASALGHSIGFWLYRYLRPTTLQFINALGPVVAVAVGVLLLGETFTPQALVGGALVVTAVAVNAVAGGGRIAAS